MLGAILIGMYRQRKLAFKVGYLTICDPSVEVLEFVPDVCNVSGENCAAVVQHVICDLRSGVLI